MQMFLLAEINNDFINITISFCIIKVVLCTTLNIKCSSAVFIGNYMETSKENLYIVNSLYAMYFKMSFQTR